MKCCELTIFILVIDIGTMFKQELDCFKGGWRNASKVNRL